MNVTLFAPTRGSIWYAYFVTPGSDAAPKARPVVVVSNEACNKSARFVTVVPLTTQLTHILPTHVIVPNSSCTGLKALSVAKAENMQAVDKEDISGYVGVLPDDIMNEIENACLVQLGIERRTEE